MDQEILAVLELLLDLDFHHVLKVQGDLEIQELQELQQVH
jgi:hypothetical protein